jgi:IclR family transcriptional regulator, pca regulon regulatory protein
MSSEKIASLAASEDFVQSLARGLSVLRVMGSSAAMLSSGEIALRTGLSRPVVRRLVLTLDALGYVGEQGGRYFLTPRVMEFGFAYLSTLPLRDIAEPVLQHVATTLHESCSVAVRDGDDIVYVARVPAKRIMSISIAVGTRLPAYCTSLGRALLSQLSDAELHGYLAHVELPARTELTVTSKRELKKKIEQARQLGYALLDQELEHNVRSIAVPILDGEGRAIAAMNVSGDASRMTSRELLKKALPLLTSGAGEIGRGLALQAR